jgi:drug/metabolite transporter (DMT)-like permease
MSATVLVAYLLFDHTLPKVETSFMPILALAAITFFSRITLFLGVKHLGGMQTALLGLAELLVTVVTATLLLGETMSAMQWIGAILLAASLVLVGFDRYTPEKRRTTGLFSWLNSPEIRPPDITIHN